MKIAVFGASVSAQATSYATGEPLGYAEFLRREQQTVLGATVIEQLCYPGNRASDGALVRILDVVDFRPDICIMEMIVEDNSRGRDASEDDYLSVIDKVISNGILPVFFIPPWPLLNSTNKAATFLRKIASACQIPMVEFPIPPEIDPKEYFNGVHTLAPGGQWYAAQLAAAILALGDIGARQQAIRAQWAAAHHGGWQAVKLEWPCDRFVRASFRIDADRPGPLRVIQRQTVGTHSLMFLSTVSREGEATNETVMSSWDAYCHYPRPSYVTLANTALGEGTSILSIEKLDIAPDYSLCRRDNVAWPAIEELAFHPLGDIFFLASTTLAVDAIG